MPEKEVTKKLIKFAKTMDKLAQEATKAYDEIKDILKPITGKNEDSDGDGSRGD